MSIDTSQLPVPYLEPIVTNEPQPTSSMLSYDGKQSYRGGKAWILPGLELLQTLDTIFLEQVSEEGETLPGMELDNQYVLKNIHGQRIWFASENTSFVKRCIFGANRPFDVNVYGYTGIRVLNIVRPLTCGLCCICGICCGNEIEVAHESGGILGFVHNITSCPPTFEAKDVSGNILFIIKGPATHCGSVAFKIYTSKELGFNEIGLITKEWGGILKESFTDLDTFGIHFPKNLRAEYKALLIGTTFLIDFTYFESRG